MLRSVKFLVLSMLMPLSVVAVDEVNEGSFSQTRMMEKAKASRLDAPTATLEVGEGVLKQDLNISISSIREANLPKLDKGMTNVTDSFSGYRFLPHGEHFAGKGAKVVLGYDRTKIPSGYTEDDIRTYYYDETEKRWIPLQRDSIDRKNRQIISRTTHFTDMINGVIQAPESPETQGFAPTMMSDLQAADPTAKVQMIEAPQANQTGSASLSYSLEMPPARNGMSPNLSIQYSSDAASGWLGEGWNLTTSSITVDTRWGVPRYNPGIETETYLLDGQMLLEDGVGLAHRNPGQNRPAPKDKRVVFHPRKESAFSEIVRIGDDPSRYIWEVTDRRGTKYTYGAYQIGKVTENGKPVYDDYGKQKQDTTYIGVLKGNWQNSGREVISEWRLTRIEEVHGDYVEYVYRQEPELVTGSLYATALYLDSVKAGNAGEKPHTVVVLHNKKDAKNIKRSDARYGYLTSSNQLLENVEVFFEGEYLRGYKFGYTQGAFGVDLLESIAHLDSDKKEFSANKFEYQDFDEKGIYSSESKSYSANRDSYAQENFFGREMKKGFGSELTMINGGRSMDGFSVGGGCNAGVGPVFGGVNYSFGYNTSDSRITLTDLNGDGLPDKVYLNKKDELVYEPAQYGSTEFGKPVTIKGAPKAFTENKSTSHTLSEDVGVGFSAASVSATFSEAWENSTTRTYFQDVNSDGLLDIVYRGKVYFNHLDKDGNPEFSFFSSDTENQLGQIKIEEIPVSEDDSDQPSEEEIKNKLLSDFPLHDAVRVWRAPFSGVVDVTSVIEMTVPVEDGTNSDYIKEYNENKEFHDGVRYQVQHQNDNFYSAWKELKPGESANVNFKSLFVTAGDYIFFRLNSIEQGMHDNVTWNPSIKYTKVTDAQGSTISTFPSVDEAGLSLIEYDSQKDFVKGVNMEVTYDGEATMTLVSSPYKKTAVTLGDVVLSINYSYMDKENPEKIVSEKTQQVVLKADELYDASIEELLYPSVSKEQKVRLRFSITSDFPFDDKVISWVPRVKAHAVVDVKDEEGAVTGSDEVDYDEVVLSPSRTMFNKYVCLVPSQKLDTDDEVDALYVNSTEENFVVSIVKSQDIVEAESREENPIMVRTYLYDEKQNVIVKEIKDGELLPIETVKGKNIRIIAYSDGELSSSSIGVKFTRTIEEEVMENGVPKTKQRDVVQNVKASIRTALGGETCRLGLLYQGWGQFAYKGEADVINLDDLKIKEDQYDEDKINEWKDKDEDEINPEDVANDMKDMMGGDATNQPFYSMSYNASDDMYYGATTYTYVSGNTQSSSRLGNPKINPKDEMQTYELPSEVEGKTGSACAPAMESGSFTFSGTLGGGLKGGFGLSGTYSHTNTTTETSVIDLNGDGYPDWVYGDKEKVSVKYTNVQGVVKDAKSFGMGMPYQESDAACLNFSGSGSANSAPGNGSGGEFSWSVDNLKAIANQRATTESPASVSASGNMSAGWSASEHEWIDVNGDGLLDMVMNNDVYLNFGYYFHKVKNAFNGDLSKGETKTVGGGLCVSIPLCGSANISAGANASYTVNNASFMMMDVNGDGLPDKVEEKNGVYYVSINKGFGQGYGSSIKLTDADISKSKATSLSIHANGGATIPVWIFTITPFVNTAKSFSVSRTLSSMSDFNGDGFPDILESSEEKSVNVRFSNIGATNKLSKVTNPFGGSFAIEYDRTRPTTEHPGGKWAMSSLTVDDATGLNPQMKTTFSYENGKRDRRERDFLGFGKVITTNVDENDNPVRSVIAEYDVTNYLTAGAPIRNLVVGATEEEKYREDKTAYVYYAVKGGSELTEIKADAKTGVLPVNAVDDNSSVFFAPAQKNTKAYEKKANGGEGLDSLSLTEETYGYTSKYGNLSSYRFRDKTNDDFGYNDTIEYADEKLGLATSVKVTGTDDTLYRHVTAEYKDKVNPTAMTKMTQFIDKENFAEYTFKYDKFGNIIRRTAPTESTKDGAFFEYEYDRKYNMYPVRVTDAFGYHSEMEDYDYRYGMPLTVRDMNGYTVKYQIDNLGRTTNILAPKEQSAGEDYTISYEYNDKGDDYKTRYAITNHFDPQHPGNPLQTVTHVDGLGRAFQVKKDAEILEKGEKMIVSGLTKYDVLGRTIETTHPNVCERADYASIVPFNKAILNTSTYDALDRPLEQTLPAGDNSGDEASVTRLGYSIEDGLMKTTIIDAKQNEQYSYTNGAEQTVKTARALGEDIVPIHYLFDPIGQVLNITDAGNDTTTYTYDMVGRKLSVSHPSAGLTTFVYDKAGNVIQKQTPNLQKEGQYITYKYEKNRLTEINYPGDESYRNVKYTYGGINAEHNRVGRVALIEDESGAQEFYYGRMGEITKQRRTLVIPNQAVATYTTEWEYDSHNRLQTMTYPDGEVVSYHYNLGGLLESVSGKKEYEYSYIKQIGYDEYEQKTFVRYGNGTETNYTYSDKRRRLKNLDVTSPAYQGDKTIMANAYTYDAMDNIISLVNGTNAKTVGGKKIAGSISHNYSYDAWNRLVHADGSYESGKDDGSASYELDMEYDELYNVTSKKLSLTQNNLQFPGTLRAGHTLKYKYDKENNDPFRLLSVSATEYRTDQLDEKSDVPSDLLVNTRCDYSFDANGNLIQTASHKNRTVVDEAQSEEESPLSEEAEKGLTSRMNKWDMDNHLLAINDNGYVSNYFYDAAGERTVKMSAGMEGLFVNGASKLDEKDVELKFVAYVSPYLVVKNGGEYTKHIYAGDQRIASKIGDFESFGADPRRVARAGADVPGVDVKYGEKYKDLFDRLTKDYEDFEVPCNVKKNEDFKDNQSFCCGSTDKLEELTQSGEGTAEETRPEAQIFFYHPDHLGSTTLVTDIDGKIIQHVAYIPYGEVFIEERDGNWNTPYLFNAKELDEETGLYYYGARYLDPKDTRWLSVDPMFEKYVGRSPYNYCGGNPISLVDPNGMWEEAPNGDMIAQKGDCAWTLHEQTGMSFGEAKDLMKSQNFQFSDDDKYVAVQIGDRVKMNKQQKSPAANATSVQKSTPKAAPKQRAENAIQEASPSFSKSGPDASGVHLSGDLIVGGGAGIDIEIGQTRSGKNYISISIRIGFGFDVGVSGGANASWYENGPAKEKDYNPKNMEGLFWYGSGGAGVSGGVSSSIISGDAKKTGDYHRWTNVSVSGGVDAGGSGGVGYTWVPFTW